MIIFKLDLITNIRYILAAGIIVDIYIIVNLIVIFINLKFL